MSTEKFASYIVGSTYDQIPELAISNAKKAVLDYIGVALAGSHEPVAKAITNFKFGRRMAYLPVMQYWLRRPLCLELVAAADLLAPVPLHPKRLKHRGFNQSLLLARTFPEVPV